ncbi:MAG: STAS domain-containing protein [Gammaproteobacteria bacterium]|nr:STAS domain-containing protein [Gammaproteobacteria bacterium]
MSHQSEARRHAPLDISVRDGSIALAGALIVDTVPEALVRSLALLPASGDLRFELDGVTHADSAALALIVEWRRAAEQRGVALELHGLPAQLRALAAATGLEELVR